MAHLIGSCENLQPNATGYVGRYLKYIRRRWTAAPRGITSWLLRPGTIAAGIFSTGIGPAAGIRPTQEGDG